MRNDKEARATGGIPVSDDLAQQLAYKAEAGNDVAVLRRRGGRRPMARPGRCRARAARP